MDVKLMDYLFVYEEKYGRKCRGVYKNCDACGNIYFCTVSDLKRGGGLYCSRKCMGNAKSGKNHHNWKGGKIHKFCQICGKEFEVDPSVEKSGNGKFCSRKCYGIYISGENHYNWKGGVTNTYCNYRDSSMYAYWRFSCMARDNFTCQKCGAKGVMLNVHHIKTVKDIFDEYNIQIRDEWENCDELWDLDNGITLCVDCHKEIHFGKNYNDSSNSANTDSFPVSSDKPSIA